MQATYTRTNRSTHASNRSADRAECLRAAYVARRTPPVKRRDNVPSLAVALIAIVAAAVAFAPAFAGGL